MLIYIILALFFGSLGSILIASLLLLLNNKNLSKISTYLLYFSGGTLLGSVFLGMMPKAITLINPFYFFTFVLIGILMFFILEKIVLWRTCQNQSCNRHLQVAVPVILIGDGMHNAIDGIVIASSFLISNEIGIFITISVILHEIPQELADFGILIKSGMSRKKALFYNLLSGSTALVSGILTYFFLKEVKNLIPFALALSVSSFLYIALADLIPEMHKKTSLKDTLLQLGLIILGIATILIAIKIK